MSTLTAKISSAIYRDGQIVIGIEGASELRFRVSENPRLARGTEAQLNRMEISPYGIHWPDLDEDLSLRGLLQGDHGQYQKVEPIE